VQQAATTVAEHQKKADTALVEDRIATRQFACLSQKVYKKPLKASGVESHR